MDEVRLGLVGCGRLAERGYVEAIRRVRGARLVGLADREPRRCSAIAAALPSYADPSELIAAGGLDAIVVATPAAAHLEGAWLASEEGLPALVEKPPAVESAQVAAMAALSKPPVFGFNRRFEPGIAKLRDRVPVGGDVELSMELHHAGGSWRAYEVADDALLTLGPHLIDLAAWLTRSSVERVRTLELSSEHVRLELSLGRGFTRISCRTRSAPRDLIQIHQGGALLAGYSARGIVRRGLRRLHRPFGVGGLVRSLALQLEAFISTVRGDGHDRLARAGDALAVMATIEVARRSAAAGGEWFALQPSAPSGG